MNFPYETERVTVRYTNGRNETRDFEAEIQNYGLGIMAFVSSDKKAPAIFEAPLPISLGEYEKLVIDGLPIHFPSSKLEVIAVHL